MDSREYQSITDYTERHFIRHIIPDDLGRKIEMSAAIGIPIQDIYEDEE